MSAYARVISDTGLVGVKALADRLQKAAHSRVKVGVPAGPTEADGTSTAVVGATVEFGRPSVGQPERPFLRGGVNDSLPAVRRVAAHDLVLVADGQMGVAVALERIGQAAAGSVKQYMAGDHFAPNAPATVDRKGSSQPTIDSSHLRQSITHVVEVA